jgi:DNA ligase-1
MGDLADGEVTHVQGSAATPYELKNTGGIYSCSCPAWRNQGATIDRRTCKHLKALRGEESELARVGVGGQVPARASSGGGGGGRKPAEKKDTEPPVLLAHPWENDVDLTGWWMSEKLDGVRAWWDGKVFVSRKGNVYHAPEWYVAGLPDHPLDGELWAGRQKFPETISVVRSGNQSQAWKQVRFLVFDAPAHEAPFEGRVEFLKKAFPPGKHPHLDVVDHLRCDSLEHLRTELARVEGLGGEGLMMRKPGSKYVAGRSATLLKVKSFFDAEAIVTGHLAGAGRHKGRLGALACELPDGTKFSVGTGYSDRERESPPPIGSVITFRYQELTKAGVPRFPSYVGVRDDVQWPPDEAAQVKRPKGKAPARAAPREEEGDDEDVESSGQDEAPAPAPAAASGGRRFECTEDGSAKFWEISVSGSSHTVTFGKLGTGGQSKTKEFADAAAAAADAAKLVGEKTKKGYVETGGVSAPKPAAPKPAPEAAPPPADDEDEGDEDEGDEDESPAAAAAAPVGRSSAPRYFESREDGSAKFWEIMVLGGTHHVRFGKIGTAGQTKSKSFPSPAAAAADAQKLIGEKTKKGYVEK